MSCENMSREQILLLLQLEVEKFYILAKLLLIEETKTKKFAVRELLRERRMKAYYATLIPRMRLTDVETFKNFHRMDPQSFDELLACLGPHMRNKPNRTEEEITPGERLAVTLRYLASGDSMKSVGFYGFRIGASTTSNIIRETSQLIWDKLKFVFSTPSEDMWNGIAQQLLQKWDFPHCLGAIDGKHVVVQAFPNHNSLTYNYKHTHSLLLMAIADADYKFIMVDIGALGHNSDGGVFKTSKFGNNIVHHAEEMFIPQPKPLPNTGDIAPYVFVADEAFPLRTNIMRPYPGRNASNLPGDETKFNCQLSRARRVVENAFGILVNRFRIYRKPIIASKETVKNIIKATVCLHNWLRGKLPLDNSYSDDQEESVRNQNLLQIRSMRQNRANAEAVNVSNLFTKYINEIV